LVLRDWIALGPRDARHTAVRREKSRVTRASDLPRPSKCACGIDIAGTVIAQAEVDRSTCRPCVVVAAWTVARVDAVASADACRVAFAGAVVELAWVRGLHHERAECSIVKTRSTAAASTILAAMVWIVGCVSNTAACFTEAVNAKRVQLASRHRDRWAESEVVVLSADADAAHVD
jgi:hypothetical protein